MFKINYILFPFIIIFGLILERYEYRDKRIKAIYIAIVLLVLLLEVALRGPSVGSDTPVYMSLYEDVENTSWGDIWYNFKRRYFMLQGTEDIGFQIVEKFINSFITKDFHLYTFIVDLSFFIPLGLLIYRYSKNIYYSMFALIMYTALFHIIALSGGRQLYAIGFCIMATLSMDKNHFKRAIIYVTIGVIFHMTALLFFMYIALNYFIKEKGKYLHLLSFFFIPFILLFTNFFILLLADASGNEKYHAYGEGDVAGGAYTFIFLMELLSLFCFWTLNYRYIYKKNEHVGNLYNALPFVTILVPLIHANGAMIRLSMYYHIYMMQLIPIACEFFFGKKQIKAYIFFLILFLVTLTIYTSNFSYIFYWNDVNYWEIDY